MLAAALDVGLVTVFAVIGRRSHAEAADAVGLFRTLWPFLAGLALGWALARAWRAPLAVRRALVVWPVTVAVGMLLRVASGQGVQVSFVVVATVVLGVFLLGWRAIGAIARLVAAGPARRAAQAGR